MSEVNLESLGNHELTNDLFYKVNSVSTYNAEGGLIGNPLIANIKNGKLVYELNKEYNDSNIDATIEMKQKLSIILEYICQCMKRKDGFSKYELESIYQLIRKAQGQALNHGFLSEAEELTKMLNREFGINVESDVQRIITIYGRRQIMRGVDCSKDIERVINDVENKEYGIMPYIKNQFPYDFKRKYYDDAKIKMSEPVKKWYGVKWVLRTFTMDDYRDAVKLHRLLIDSVKSVATM